MRVLQYLPENDPLRPRYEQQFKEMCIKLAKIQRPDGLWSSGLLDPSHQAETSGSAFFVYGMAYGINENLLDKDKFIPVLETAWPALCGYVQEDGDGSQVFNRLAKHLSNMIRTIQSPMV